MNVVQVLWWDIRKLSEPFEKFCLDETRRNDCHWARGAVSLEYEPTMVTQFIDIYSIRWFVLN